MKRKPPPGLIGGGVTIAGQTLETGVNTRQVFQVFKAPRILRSEG
jgi:hypothetical protein